MTLFYFWAVLGAAITFAFAHVGPCLNQRPQDGWFDCACWLAVSLIMGWLYGPIILLVVAWHVVYRKGLRRCG